MVPRHDPEYMLKAAATAQGRDYKARLISALDVHIGHTVVDVGCGPGTDLTALSTLVGAEGLVVGLDQDPSMAQLVEPDTSIVALAGDAHRLPLAGASVDRIRADRVLMHLDDPARAVAELHRVLKPGGVATLAEPDWETLFFDSPDLATSSAYTRFVCDRVVRNAAIGRSLGRLADLAGFAQVEVECTPVVFQDYGAGEQILRMPAVLDRAVKAGLVEAPAGQAWLDGLKQNRFMAGFMLFTAVARS